MYVQCICRVLISHTHTHSDTHAHSLMSPRSFRFSAAVLFIATRVPFSFRFPHTTFPQLYFVFTYFLLWYFVFFVVFVSVH